MTPQDMIRARKVLGRKWGLARDLAMSELASALRLGGASPAQTVRNYERGKSDISGPISVAIGMMLGGALPPDGLGCIIKDEPNDYIHDYGYEDGGVAALASTYIAACAALGRHPYDLEVIRDAALICEDEIATTIATAPPDSIHARWNMGDDAPRLALDILKKGAIAIWTYTCGPTLMDYTVVERDKGLLNDIIDAARALAVQVKAEGRAPQSVLAVTKVDV